MPDVILLATIALGLLCTGGAVAIWSGWLLDADDGAIDVTIDDDPTQRSARPAELAAVVERQEEARRWLDSLPDEAPSSAADSPTVAIDLSELRKESRA